VRQHGLEPLQARRSHLELYLCDLQNRGYAAATISRRLSTVAGLFRYAVIDELVPGNATLAVTRPKAQWEGQKRPVLHPVRVRGRPHHRPAAQRHRARPGGLLGMLGLRVSKACQTQVSDLQYTGGYQVLRVTGKGSKPAQIPLPIPVCAQCTPRSPDDRPDPSCSATTVSL
jgi:integrase/recombinase XerD